MTLLGAFIKGRRGRVSPDEAGLTSSGRRRVPGLRRDELARLAGVSERYLTRLEQGTDDNPSPQVLQALATALRLSPDETAHLFALASTPAVPGVQTVDLAEIQQLVDSWPSSPAYVRDQYFDVVVANKLALALSPLYTPGQNLVRGIFLDPAARELFPDWPDVAAQTAAALRAEADLSEPRTAQLVDDLMTDDYFRDLWGRHDVRPTRNELKRFDHPVVGSLSLRRQSLSVAGADGLVVITYHAEPSSPDADALARLL
ncbi:helix-turn-helix transcriptional regulator [Kribbella jejuensis]|uniref:Transcriptional regulator with XRE-family HTH domain n=1 Tax=Kribbella jejuensis TaxID=236068 RepID=A0A542EA56_9ACTN|nr:helix-turn-helix transcriptional regulator [Kribbella jejuensis]TQJ12217.1 transcriptional regulator with XRE-family HTH domain [Kribbella jejuensis]